MAALSKTRLVAATQTKGGKQMSSSKDAGTRFFTGRQVTTMVVALMATVVLLPSAVWAVDTFSNVAIMDPVSGVKAKVDNTRKLNVGDGAGNITVDGTVVAQAAAPSELRRFFGDAPLQPSCRLIAAPASGKALILSTLNVDFGYNSTGTGYVGLYVGTSPCPPVPLQYVDKAQNGVVSLDFGPGLAIPSGSGLYANHRGDFVAYVAAYGHQVPASAVPATASAAETNETTSAPPRP